MVDFFTATGHLNSTDRTQCGSTAEVPLTYFGAMDRPRVKRALLTEVLATDAGVRLLSWRRDARSPVRRWKVTSLRVAGVEWFDTLEDAQAGFEAEVAASRSDPVLGPIING